MRVLTKRADENKSRASAERLQVAEDNVIPGEGAGFLVHVSKPVEPAELVASVTGHAGGPVRQG